MKKRIQWIDVAKGLLIILVIVGHAHVNSIVDLIIANIDGEDLKTTIDTLAKIRKILGE